MAKPSLAPPEARPWGSAPHTPASLRPAGPANAHGAKNGKMLWLGFAVCHEFCFTKLCQADYKAHITDQGKSFVHFFKSGGVFRGGTPEPPEAVNIVLKTRVLDTPVQVGPALIPDPLHGPQLTGRAQGQGAVHGGEMPAGPELLGGERLR